MQVVGFLMDDLTDKARIHWDALPGAGYIQYSYDFPIIREVVPGATEQRLIDSGGDLSLTPRVIETAKKLESRGATAISTGCGFYAMFQEEVAKAVSVPVVLSSLLQVPLISQIMGKKTKFGILTWSNRFLGEQFFNAVGWSSKDISVVVGKGLDEFPVWKEQIYNPEMFDDLEAATVEIAEDLLKENPDIGAFVFECAGLPGYGRSIQKKTGRPVFNLVTLVRMIFAGISFG